MISFIDLKAQQKLIRDKIENRINKVLDHGQYIQGPEIKELETSLSTYTNTKYVLCCSSGTDALVLSLLGLGIKPGDAVIVPSFTFASSAEAIVLLGAVPIFSDVLKDTFNIDPKSVIQCIDVAKQNSLIIKGIMTVGLFGQPCNMDEIKKISKQYDFWILDDAAQSFGSEYKGKRTGSLADVSATSFFPAKPLGCYGDGGALFTNDKEIFDIAYSCHIHGTGLKKYSYDRIGFNGRMDSIQAGVLIEKLSIFDAELKKRQNIAKNYYDLIQNLNLGLKNPKIDDFIKSSWAQYTIKLPKSVNRDNLQHNLKANGIPTAIYYPIPLHKQKPYMKYPISKGGLNITEELSNNVISLPMHPYLSSEEVEHIVEKLGDSIST